MTTESMPGVPACLPRRVAEMERAPTVYSSDDLAAARRLVSDPAMAMFYADPWFKSASDVNLPFLMWGPDMWPIWFDRAWHAASYPLVDIRRQKGEQVQAMHKLVDALGSAADAMESLRGVRDGPLSLPLEFRDPTRLLSAAASASGRRGVDGRYHAYVERDMQKLGGQFDLKYWPDGADILEALAMEAHAWLADHESKWIDAAERAAVSSRTQSAVPEYVRLFDETMTESEIQFDFPDRLLAIQCATALGLTRLIGDEASRSAFIDRVRHARSK